jgi:hypothetical protein
VPQPPLHWAELLVIHDTTTGPPLWCPQDTLTGAIKSTGVDLDTVSKTTSTVAKTAADGATAAQPLLSKVRAAPPRPLSVVQGPTAHCLG